VSYARIDPARAREIFIEGALVAGEFESPHPFWAHNRRLIREIEELEHRARRPDVLVDERVVFEFYDRQIPRDIRDPRGFDAWYRKAVEKKPDLLQLTREDLMRHGAESITEELFPRTLQMDGATFPLAYRFEPTHPLDGVTINVPLAALNQVDEAAIDWLVPGMVRDKVAWTMKALPKRIRTQLVPVPDHVTQFLERTQPGGKNVRDAVLDYASRIAGERLDADIWSKDESPPHLRMNIRVVDDAKRDSRWGATWALRKRLGEAATVTLAKSKPGVERDGITSWDFGDLPETVTFRRNNQSFTGYLALAPAPDSKSVAIRMYDTPDRALSEHREAVKVLMGLELKEQLRNLERGMNDLNPVALKIQATIPSEKLKADLLAAIVDRAFIGEDDAPRTAKAYEDQKKRAKARLPAVTEGAKRYLAAIVEASQQYAQVVAQSGALGRVVQDVKAARERLVYPGFISRTPWERLEHIPRYLKGYALRLQKYPANAERDQKHAVTAVKLWSDYDARLKGDREAGRHDSNLEEFRWLIEELRVSLFAQELKRRCRYPRNACNGSGTIKSADERPRQPPAARDPHGPHRALRGDGDPDARARSRGARRRRDPRRDRGARFPHAPAHRGGSETRARRQEHVLHVGAGAHGAARGDLAFLFATLRPRRSREPDHRDRRVERGVAARLRRAARSGRRGAAVRSGLSLQPPLRAHAGCGAAPGERRAREPLPDDRGCGPAPLERAHPRRTRRHARQSHRHHAHTRGNPRSREARAGERRHAHRRRDLSRPGVRRRGAVHRARSGR
jgi:hypothetical protein